jgi:hypothetical protein
MKIARKTEVINKDTGEKIPRVIWANDETGRYRQILADENGIVLYSPAKPAVMKWRVTKGGKIKKQRRIRHAKILSKIFTANIELRSVA